MKFIVGSEEEGQTLAALVRQHGMAATWSRARVLVESGKVFVDGRLAGDSAMRPPDGALVELRPAAPRPIVSPPGRIVHDDTQVVVLDKPAGISSVPYEERETGTAMDLIRDHWRASRRSSSTVPLHVVHRIDKETSGLIVFAKTKLAERSLAGHFRAHEIERTYLCIVHGHLTDRRIESRLVEDRGDGLRGSTRHVGQGKQAITHVTALDPLEGAMLCEVRLETGKTHQIRIHLSENGHPIVGERVYIRDFLARGNEPIPAERLLLHAATLGFIHPTTGETLRFESELPDDFRGTVNRLRRAPRRRDQ